MKNLIKELMKREGGKSNLKIGDCREVLKHLADVLADPDSDGSLGNEFAAYCASRSLKATKKHSRCLIQFQYIKTPATKKKKAVKKAGRK